MAIKLKKLDEQVIVITGATSGIGLATARAAAEAGARLVLVARDADALDALAHEMRQLRRAIVATVKADVGVAEDVARIGQTAIDQFGRVDTWINNAGVSVYGKSEEVALEDMQRVMQTNFWGTVNGSLEAVRLMKAHGSGGGAVINVGSEVSSRAIPLQGTYSASKHAVKAFTESLRMELDKDKAPISLTLIKPASIATPFTQHAKNYMEMEPALPKPIYAPELVAKTILHAAQTPARELVVGGRSRMMAVAAQLMPRSLDGMMRAMAFRQQQQTDKPSSPTRRDALYAPVPEHELRQRDESSGKPAETNLYTAYQMRSGATKTVLLGGALLAAWALTRRPARRMGHALRGPA